MGKAGGKKRMSQGKNNGIDKTRDPVRRREKKEDGKK